MAEHEVITGTQESRMVKRVGDRISSAVEKYLAAHNKSDIIEGYDWEFNLVKDDSVNAWAMPGGWSAITAPNRKPLGTGPCC